MTERDVTKKLPSLRRYLMFWFAGCAIVMVVAYTQLLEYYLDLGIDLRTQTFLERTAISYNQQLSKGERPRLLDDRVVAYRNLTELPSELLDVFPVQNLRHGEVRRFVNLDLIDDDDLAQRRYRVESGGLCGEVNCELLFLYPYKLNDGQWLYLVHGLVGSDEAFAELELTEQVAFAIGSLFVGLLTLVSFLMVRSVDAPLRQLERWSAAQTGVSTSHAIPELRFRELDVLAQRMQGAFARMREGVEKERRFLRHASHELRTPIAIVRSNVELLEKLVSAEQPTQAAAFARQYRALDDVQLLIETLLWANRQSEQMPKSELLSLKDELQTIIEDYRDLLDDRLVTVRLEGNSPDIHAPVAAVRVVLSNLVRNAFQHTLEGDVLIEVSDGQVSVVNESAGSGADEAAERWETDGFGLGLDLVAQICTRCAWRSSSIETKDGRRTTVVF